MESRSHAIAAGLFAIVLSAGVVLALWWFSDKREATRELVLVTSSSVNGLNPQATVRYRGIVAGKVAGIGLDPGNPRDVLVTVRIRADLPVTQGTRARLATQGVTGLAFIALDDSGEDAAPLAGDPPRIRLAPGLIDEVSAASLQTLTRVRELAERLAGLANPDNLARIERTLAHLERSSQGLERTLQEAPQTLAAVRQVFSKDNLARISRSLDNLERLSGEAVPLAREGRTLLTRLQTVSERIDSLAGATGEGVATSTLPRLNGLLQELTITSRQLSDLLDEIDNSPQLLLLGRGKPVPGPGEAGFRQPGH
ncbi:MlaD family protein [Zoogloea sp.]|mgnify:CR=1 FL=1|uniref:MlaD family protein n=1 Tax=Zoogloea sp. TaxID=49181 RepID=UPI00261E33AD|nr:MlaD family protein [uncultured Zoogloea sp.]MCK6387018.1 MlaD family protein [Zoogloea sp.]